LQPNAGWPEWCVCRIKDDDVEYVTRARLDIVVRALRVVTEELEYRAQRNAHIDFVISAARAVLHTIDTVREDTDGESDDNR